MKYMNHGLPYVSSSVKERHVRFSHCLDLLRNDDNEKKDRGAASENAGQSELLVYTIRTSKLVRHKSLLAKCRPV